MRSGRPECSAFLFATEFCSITHTGRDTGQITFPAGFSFSSCLTAVYLPFSLINGYRDNDGCFPVREQVCSPTKEQREHYFNGEFEEFHFGPDGQIVLILYPEAAYLKDDIENVRILFTGNIDRQKVQDEVRRLVDYYEQNENGADAFSTGSKV